MRISRETRVCVGTARWRPGFCASAGRRRRGAGARRAREAEAEAGGGKADDVLRVAVVCGGPSAERGISLNSARSLLDHLSSPNTCVAAYYVDRGMAAFPVSHADLYSNTPSDFDYKLDPKAQFNSLEALASHIARTADVAFPAIHGPFGEDGELQRLLEDAGVPFVGTASANAAAAFDKASAAAAMRGAGFPTIPNMVLARDDVADAASAADHLSAWAPAAADRLVVKPANAGSSLGVTVARDAMDAVRAAANLLNPPGSAPPQSAVVVEPYVRGAREFTVIVVGAPNNGAVALLPTEVEFAGEPSDDDIFTYRQKYLPTQQVSYHTPPREMSAHAVAAIRRDAVAVYHALGLRDFARIDGWLLTADIAAQLGIAAPSAYANAHEFPVFFDVNIISGMEQNSFLFQQAAAAGLGHAAILNHTLSLALARADLPAPVPRANKKEQRDRREVCVLFGGATSERQVSLLSGINIWMKLNALAHVDATPFLLAPHATGAPLESLEVLRLPYASTLRHTVEEVIRECALEERDAASLDAPRQAMRGEVMRDLKAAGVACSDELANATCDRLTLEQLLRRARERDAVLFIAVHGGVGEDGSVQQLCEELGVTFTGTGSEASKICMDKNATGAAIDRAFPGDEGVLSCAKHCVETDELIRRAEDATALWAEVRSALGLSDGEDVCIKPLADGCSTGVCRLRAAEDLAVYASALAQRLARIPADSLSCKPHGVIEMPVTTPDSFLCEPFVVTGSVSIRPSDAGGSSRLAEQISWRGDVSRWIEVTVGVLGSLEDPANLEAMEPSLTVAESGAGVLSLEEKFQGGTGVNLTPIPEFIAPREVVQVARANVARAAMALGIRGFARVDCFLHVDTGAVVVIEANTVPGMTPSTVLLHQALQRAGDRLGPSAFFGRVAALARGGAA